MPRSSSPTYPPTPRCSRLGAPARQSPSRWCCPHQAGFQRQCAGQAAPGSHSLHQAGHNVWRSSRKNHPPSHEPAASDSSAPARPARRTGTAAALAAADAKNCRRARFMDCPKSYQHLGVSLVSRLSVTLSNLLPLTDRDPFDATPLERTPALSLSHKRAASGRWCEPSCVRNAPNSSRTWTDRDQNWEPQQETPKKCASAAVKWRPMTFRREPPGTAFRPGSLQIRRRRMFAECQ